MGLNQWASIRMLAAVSLKPESLATLDEYGLTQDHLKFWLAICKLKDPRQPQNWSTHPVCRQHTAHGKQALQKSCVHATKLWRTHRHAANIAVADLDSSCF